MTDYTRYGIVVLAALCSSLVSNLRDHANSFHDSDCPYVFGGSGAGQNPNDTIRAWSSTAGPDGVVWHLSIERDSTATASSSSDLGAKSVERHFKISAAQRQAILRAAEEGQFFTLPESIGPRSLPIHGPQNTLELAVGGRSHKVFLNDPASAKDSQAERFRRVWRAVVETSPIKPPL